MKWRFQKFHHDEGGAVLILCLAAVMILLLMAWTVYDTGTSARDKIESQAAADVAAYSQAAVKARSMNMIAYANISKRSIWGVHSLYPAYLSASHSWIRDTINSNCQMCADGPPDSMACRRCDLALTERRRWINSTCDRDSFGGECNHNYPQTWGTFRSMSGRAYDSELVLNSDGTRIIGPSQFPDPVITDFGAKGTLDGADPLNSMFERYYAEDMRAIDNYQRYIYGVTPWWGWSEQLIRSTRSGATTSVSWPAPVGRFPSIAYSIETQLMNSFRQLASSGGRYDSGMGNNYTVYTDTLPIYPGNVGTMKATLAQLVGNAPGGLWSCVRSVFTSESISNACRNGFHPFVIEHLINAVIFMLKSEGVVGGRGTFATLDGFVLIHANAILGNAFREVGLGYTQQSFANIMEGNRIVAEPWLMERYRNDATWQLKSSNIVMAYNARFQRFDEAGDRQKFGTMKDYRRSDGDQEAMAIQRYLFGGPDGANLAAQRITYGASGYWSMARSEIYFQDSDNGAPDMWHPSWSARMRPVSLGDEFFQGQYNMNQVFHDVLASLALTSIVGVTSLSDITRAAVDMFFMENATSAMGPSTAGGISK